MNTPTRPLEASGTSGEKGVMNGTLHFSVLDGWWVEGYKKDAGWALPAERTYDVQDFQDELDAETIYDILEQDVVPAYYTRNQQDVPEKWISYVKNTLAQVSPHFTTARMIKDYQDRYYNPQYLRSQKVNADAFKLGKELAAWKAELASKWDAIEVKSIAMSDGVTNKMVMGNEYPVKVTVDLKGLSCNDVGCELVITESTEDGQEKIADTVEFKAESCDGTICCYNRTIKPDHPGSFSYSFRLFGKNENLAHRQDFKYVKWIN
jgi:glucan phosphorylase